MYISTLRAGHGAHAAADGAEAHPRHRHHRHQPVAAAARPARGGTPRHRARCHSARGGRRRAADRAAARCHRRVLRVSRGRDGFGDGWFLLQGRWAGRARGMGCQVGSHQLGDAHRPFKSRKSARKAIDRSCVSFVCHTFFGFQISAFRLGAASCVERARDDATDCACERNAIALV